MDIKNIKALVDLMNQGRLTSLEVCEGETKIRLFPGVVFHFGNGSCGRSILP